MRISESYGSLIFFVQLKECLFDKYLQMNYRYRVNCSFGIVVYIDSVFG